MTKTLGELCAFLTEHLMMDKLTRCIICATKEEPNSTRYRYKLIYSPRRPNIKQQPSKKGDVSLSVLRDKAFRLKSIPLLLKDNERIHSQTQYVPSALATLVLQQVDIR